MTDLNNRVTYLRRHRAHDPDYDMPPRHDAPETWPAFFLVFSAPFVGLAIAAVVWGVAG